MRKTLNGILNPAAADHASLPPQECSLGRLDRKRDRGQSFYDPLLGKVLVHGKDRGDTRKLQQALSGTEIHGIQTNLGYLRAVSGPG